MHINAVLSIAGSDSSGGAGIQADIKTIAAHKLFAETAIAALTAQNTTGVYGIVPIDPAFVAQQIDVVFDDIPPAAVKVGMVSSAEIARVIAERLIAREARNVVIDPVMVATSGSRLIDEEAIETLKCHLLPCADVLTPNLPEAEVLVGRSLNDAQDMEEAAVEIARSYSCAALVKGGHTQGHADDVLASSDGEIVWLHAPRIATNNTHGTGCTLSSAIACALAQGFGLVEAVQQAKRYVSGALSAGLELGHGCGPLDHMWEYR